MPLLPLPPVGKIPGAIPVERCACCLPNTDLPDQLRLSGWHTSADRRLRAIEGERGEEFSVSLHRTGRACWWTGEEFTYIPGNYTPGDPVIRVHFTYDFYCSQYDFKFRKFRKPHWWLQISVRIGIQKVASDKIEWTGNLDTATLDGGEAADDCNRDDWRRAFGAAAIQTRMATLNRVSPIVKFSRLVVHKFGAPPPPPQSD